MASSLFEENGWTGGQYSLYRAALGVYLAIHFAALLPYGTELFSDRGMIEHATSSPFFPWFPNLWFAFDAPGAVFALLLLACGASVLLAAGFRDRVAALFVWYVLACTFTRNPLISNPSLPFIGWLLLAHSALAARPYGAWDTRGRDDPRGDFNRPPTAFAATWVVMAAGYSYSGITKLVSPSWIDGSAVSYVLSNPLARPTALRSWLLELPDVLLRLATWGALFAELLFLPLALFARTRPIIWLALLSMHLGLALVIDFFELSVGMMILHLATFDPRWLAPRSDGPMRLFYDGDCGLCHRAVRFVLSEDPTGRQFVFTSLASPLGQRLRDGYGPEPLPDSLILESQDGELQFRSSAVLATLDRLGGLWRVVGWCFAPIPRGVLDFLYDRIAETRKRIFREPSDACPVISPELRRRFDEGGERG